MKLNYFWKMLKKKSFLRRLLDLDDREVSSTNLYLFVVTFIGCIMLLVPVVILLVEIYYNHTITTNLDGLASYVAAVSAMFASVGITKGWTSWTYSRYGQNKKYSEKNNDEEEQQTEQQPQQDNIDK